MNTVNRFLRNIYIFLVLFSLNISCFEMKTTTSSTKPGDEALYNPYVQQLHPQYFVYNASKERSRLYIKLNLNELMFSPVGENRSYISKVKIAYNVLQPDESGTFIDSASVVFEIKKRKGENSAITYLNISDKGYNKFYLQINTRDLFKQTKAEDFIIVDRENSGNLQDFLISLNSTNYPYFNNFFNSSQLFNVQLNTIADSIYIRYFGGKVPLPPPPFSTLSRAELFTYSDSSWSITGKGSSQFSSKKEGLYYFQTDSTLKYGLGLVNCGDDFPYVKRSEEMVYPLEYLMSTAEFKNIISSQNKKLSVDKFWLTCGKNPNRARELIRIYYNRVFYANVYFTSYTQGWRTDRGMIYIIFGPPKSVQKAPDKETWFYFDKTNAGRLQFVFTKYPNPYTQNDYILSRHIDFKRFWDEALASWRSGRVYTVFG